MKNLKNIYLIVGPSGSGKTTLVKNLVERDGFRELLSYTTRPKRCEDEGGHTYISIDDLKTYEGKIVARTTFDDNIYFATEDQIDNCDIYVIDPYGVSVLKTQYKGNRPMKVIFLDCDKYVAFDRMIKRGDDRKKALKRLDHDENTFSRMRYNMAYDYLVNSNSFTEDELYEFVKQIIMEMEG